MLFKARSAAVYGIDAHIIDVEVDFSGVHLEKEIFSTVGLPDAAVRESRDRVKAAIRNSGFDLPPTHITINLAPADIKKEGSGFDLPMAVGILGAYGALQIQKLDDESAFRLADLENRTRKDVSEIERARNYAWALDAHYGGTQARMAERLKLSKGWLSKMLTVAQIPDGIIAAFASHITLSNCIRN